MRGKSERDWDRLRRRRERHRSRAHPAGGEHAWDGVVDALKSAVGPDARLRRIAHVRRVRRRRRRLLAWIVVAALALVALLALARFAFAAEHAASPTSQLLRNPSKKARLPAW